MPVPNVDKNVNVIWL